MKIWRLVMGALVIAIAMTGCGEGDDDGMMMPDAGMGGVDGGGGGTDAGGGDTDAGGGDTDAGGGDTDAGMGDAGTDAGMSDAGGGDAPTFADLREGLASCMGCHQGAGPAGFSLAGSDAQVYAELVDEARTDDGCPSNTRRVVPNNTSMSVLYLRTHGNTCGSMMPANSMQRQLIENWINAGAPGPL